MLWRHCQSPGLSLSPSRSSHWGQSAKSPSSRAFLSPFCCQNSHVAQETGKGGSFGWGLACSGGSSAKFRGPGKTSLGGQAPSTLCGLSTACPGLIPAPPVLGLFLLLRVTDEVFNFLLVWYYCTLTIRESILISNGSR